VSKILEILEPRAERGSRWAARVQPEAPLCACGCGQPVELKGRHRSAGVPRYAHGHHPNPIRRAYERLRSKGYRLVADTCAEFGISPTTLRRLEADGVLPKTNRLKLFRGRSVRVFTDDEIRRVHKVLAKRRLCGFLAMLRSTTRLASGSTLACSKNVDTCHVGEILKVGPLFLVRDEFSETDVRKWSRVRARVHTPFHARAKSIRLKISMRQRFAFEYPDRSGPPSSRTEGTKPNRTRRARLRGARWIICRLPMWPLAGTRNARDQRRDIIGRQVERVSSNEPLRERSHDRCRLQ
jgi:hypothetical protein